MLFRGGRRDAEVLLAEFDAVGLGVEDILMAASSCDMSDILLLRPRSRIVAISAPASVQIRV